MSLTSRRRFLVGLFVAVLASASAATASISFAQEAAPGASASGVTRLCIIGNSHVTALRQAVMQGLFSDSKLDLVFWAFPGRSYSELKFEGGKFTHPNKRRALAQTGGRFESIEPRDFDALIFVGPGFKPGNILLRLHQRAGDDTQTIETDIRSIISNSPELEPMFAAARENPEKKVYYVPWPMPPESSGRGKDVEIDPREFDTFNRVAAKLFADRGIKYIAQPAETIEARKWTKNEYSRGTDFIHMNAQYGKLVLQAIRERLRASD